MSPLFQLWIAFFINLNRTPRFIVWIRYCCASVIFMPPKFEGKHTFLRTFCSSMFLIGNTKKSVTIRITTYLEIINSTCVFIVWHSLSNSETGKFVPVGFESVEHDARSQCPHLFPSELPFLSTSTAHHCFLSGSSIVVQVLYSFPRNLKGKMHFSGLLVPPLSWWYKNHLHVRSN